MNEYRFHDKLKNVNKKNSRNKNFFQKGSTLFEVLISLFLFGLVLNATMAYLVDLLRSQRHDNAQAQLIRWSTQEKQLAPHVSISRSPQAYRPEE